MKLKKYIDIYKVKKVDDDEYGYIKDICRVYGYNNIDNMSTDKVFKLYKKIQREIDGIDTNFKIGRGYIRIGWRFFKINKDLKKWRFGNFVGWDTLVMNSSDEDMLFNLDEILSYCLDEYYLGFRLKRSIEWKKRYIMKHIDVRRCLAINFFYLNYVGSCILNTKEYYLVERMKLLEGYTQER